MHRSTAWPYIDRRWKIMEDRSVVDEIENEQAREIEPSIATIPSKAKRELTRPSLHQGKFTVERSFFVMRVVSFLG